MKQAFFISAGTFIVTLMLSFSNEFRLFIVGFLWVVLVFSVLSGYVGFGWLMEWQRIKKEERLKVQAERKKAEMDAEYSVVTTSDNQVHIRETNHSVNWRTAHLDRRIYANGHWTEPDERDIAAWMAWNFRNSPAQLPNMIGREEDIIDNPPQSYKKLSEIDFIHMLIVGPSGSGKTTVANWEIDNFPESSTVYALDPHEKFNTWSPRAQVVGNGRNFNAIDSQMDYLLSIMDKRFNSGKTRFDKILIVADEWLSISDNCKNSEKFFKLIGSEARKVDIHLIVMTISATVDDLNCTAAVRENLIQLTLNRTLKSQNLAELRWSKKDSELIELPGPYFCLPKQDEVLVLDSGPTAWSPTDEEFRIYNLYQEGTSFRKIVSEIKHKELSKVNSFDVDKIKESLKKFGVCGV